MVGAETTETGGALSEQDERVLQRVGYAQAASRSATAVLVDHELRVASSGAEGVEILSIQDALMRYDWVQDLMFNLIAPDENELLRQAAELLNDPIGCFIYVHPGVQVRSPVQSFTVMNVPQERQFTHNITVIGENADVEMISGAAAPEYVHAGHHVSIDETYVREGARCRSVCIDRWGENMRVDSYARTQIAAGADLTSSQIMTAPLRHHFSDSKTYVGARASCNDQSIIFAPDGAERIFDTEVVLTGEGARSEHVARMVSAGGRIINQSLLVGEAAGVSGFLGCDGLMLSDDGEILATPSLKAQCAEAQLSHEASVGMIDSDKLAYLMASGLTEDRARDLIVQGFLSLDDESVPPDMRKPVAQMIAAAKSGGM